MPSFDFKKIRLDLYIVLGFIVVSFLYCYPQLQGKKLKQNDGVSWLGMSHEATAYHDSTGYDVLWSNSMFGGMPTYTHAVEANTNNYPAYIQMVLEALGKPAYFFFIAMLCFYILMRVLGINRWLSVAASVAYSFASYNAIIIGVGHDTKMLSIAYMPAAFAGIYLIYKEKWLSGAALWGIFIALLACNAHYQVMYYLIMICFCFGVCMFFMAIKENKIKQFFISTLIAVSVGVLGMLPNITALLTTNEYSKQTMRGGTSELSGHDKKASGGLDKSYAFQWSMGVGESFCMMVPYLYGGASEELAEKAPKTAELVGSNSDMLPTYWGEQPFQSGPVYLGAVICFLFLLGLLVVRSPHKWWILAASVIGIVLSWGKNFPEVNYFLFDHIPMLNKFRTVEMALIIPQFLFPLLGIWAVQDIIDKKLKPDVLWKDVKIAAGVTVVLCLLLGVGGSMFFKFTGSGDAQYQAELVKALKEDRASMASMSGIKSAIYILIAAGLLWAFIKDKIKPMVLMIGLVAIIAIDLIPVSLDYLSDKNYVDASDFDTNFEPRDVDKQILRDKDPYFRVYDRSRNTYNDAIQAYFFKCIGGYHPAKLEIYQDLIDRQMGGQGFLNAKVFDMLNTKYIIVGGQKSPPQVIPNPEACGNAWFVNDVKWANTADEEMDGLNGQHLGDTTTVPNGFEPQKTAIMRTTFKDVMGDYNFGKDSAAYIKLDRYGLDDISFISHNSKDGLGVFSDIYYAAGWKAYVDDKETPIMRVNYVLRAIKIPAKDHKIRFEFRPQSFYGGRKIALAGSLLLFALFIGALFPLFKKDKPVQNKA